MNRILNKREYLSHHSGDARKRLSPPELAIGWPSGLQRLIEVGFSVLRALCLSIHIEDLTSTKLLLTADNFPGEDLRGWADVFHEVSRSNNPEMQDLVIENLARRRRSLAELAIQHLPEEELLDLGLSHQRVLDSAALTVYGRLRERSVHVPSALVPPLLSPYGHEHLSVYQFLCRSFCLSPHPHAGILSLRLLDSLCENGFCPLAEAAGLWKTPLLLLSEALTKTRVRGHVAILMDNTLPFIHWLLDRGARPESTHGYSFPSVLFYVAIHYGWCLRNGTLPLTVPFERLCQRLTSLSNPTHPDGCYCYCSDLGCLPAHKFWKCNGVWWSHDCCEPGTRRSLSEALEQWINVCRLDEAQSQLCHRAICRLEVFDRLGMAHTCCKSVDGKLRSWIPREEREQLQAEDQELNQQLDLIMQAYESSRERYIGGVRGFWEHWWSTFDEILPEIEPEQRCRSHCTYIGAYHS